MANWGTWAAERKQQEVSPSPSLAGELLLPPCGAGAGAGAAAGQSRTRGGQRREPLGCRRAPASSCPRLGAPPRPPSGWRNPSGTRGRVVFPPEGGKTSGRNLRLQGSRCEVRGTRRALPLWGRGWACLGRGSGEGESPHGSGGAPGSMPSPVGASQAAGLHTGWPEISRSGCC